ncbi:hypothetical protein [Caulobacter sp. 17J80-11]|uniref:hypothetical protein n=1 Tax=Caulobacter sp. 17J80-11 TaxID=2763502 RepID=UPI0016535684|nr:hypothetical protein [Caulobacter sp. 17J80-11]MBC6982183.1 hypothetical protein [Caulobacter sp. 17J80-11]
MAIKMKGTTVVVGAVGVFLLGVVVWLVMLLLPRPWSVPAYSELASVRGALRYETSSTGVMAVTAASGRQVRLLCHPLVPRRGPAYQTCPDALRRAGLRDGDVVTARYFPVPAFGDDPEVVMELVKDGARLIRYSDQARLVAPFSERETEQGVINVLLIAGLVGGLVFAAASEVKR